jgi:sulfite exporter TauE/SafE
MTELPFLTAFLIGIAGGVHCFGMCGGITFAMRAACPANQSHLPYALCYHAGRIVSYTIAGALSGALGAFVSTASVHASLVLKVLSITMLILMALYIGQWYRGLTHVEKLGAKLWRVLQPMSKRFLPFQNPLMAIPYGMIWGWLPCGLVYSTLSWSISSKDIFTGAGIMLAFGLGTYPTMLAASMAVSSVTAAFKHVVMRQAIAVLMFFYAFYLVVTGF